MRLQLAVLAAGTIVLACGTAAPSVSPESSGGCRLERDGSTSGEFAAVCERLAQRWILLTGDTVIPGQIRFTDRSGFLATASSAGWSLDWGRPAAGRTIPRHFIENIIPHEAAHQVFRSYTNDLNPHWDGVRYGSIAPDWFDEAPAVWAESDSMRAARLAPVRDAEPSLAAVLTMPHPSRELIAENGRANVEFQIIERTVTPPCERCTWLDDTLRTKYRVVSVRLFPDGRTSTVVSYADRSPNDPASNEERHFYPLAYSVLQYVHARGGSAAFRELLARYRADPAPREDVLNGLPGLPASFDAVQRDWHRFLREL